MPASERQKLRFGPFELDPSCGELRRDGVRIKLQGQPIQVLEILLEKPGELVSREEIRQRIWSADTFVDFDHNLNTAVKKLRQALGDEADSPRFIETLPRLGYRFVAPVIRERMFREAALPRIQSLAVLPLANLSGDLKQQYFADGMTDELITHLGQIGALRVISRTSVMQYDGTRKPLPEIARELHVDTIVEGAVLRSGDRVRITAQLIDATADRHLWAASYERDLRDVLSMQDEVAGAIANQIRIKLTPRELQNRVGARPVNLEAYEDYLRGRFEWYKISRRGFDTAERYYQLALEKDPDFALAYAGLANVWFMRTDSGQEPASAVIPKATSAVLKAVELDPNLSEPHVILANIDFAYKRDWTSAEREFQRAIDLNPNNLEAHFMLADYLISLKRNQEWHVEIQKALALDPVSSFTPTFYAWHLVYLGRCDEAIEALQAALALQPGFASACMGLWGAYYKKHMEAQAMQEAVKFFQSINDEETAAALKAGYLRAGYREGMRRAAEVLAFRAQRTHVPSIRIARLYAHAGDSKGAIQWLERAYEAHESPLIHLGVAWDWDSLRSDPRFQDLMRRMSLPQ